MVAVFYFLDYLVTINKMYMSMHYIVVMVLLSIAGNGLAQVPGRSEIKNNKIKKITVRSVEQGEDHPLITTWFYNENGDDTAYSENGDRRSYKVIGYNRKLQPLTVSRFFPDGKEMDKTVFTYKSDGSSTSVNTDAEFGMKVTDSYDKKGNQLSHTIPDGTVTRYIYNAKGQLTSSYSIPVQGEKKSTSQYTYNAKGKLIASVNKGEYASSIVYQYDAKGLLKKEIISSLSPSGEKTVNTYEYEYEY